MRAPADGHVQRTNQYTVATRSSDTGQFLHGWNEKSVSVQEVRREARASASDNRQKLVARRSRKQTTRVVCERERAKAKQKAAGVGVGAVQRPATTTLLLRAKKLHSRTNTTNMYQHVRKTPRYISVIYGEEKRNRAHLLALICKRPSVRCPASVVIFSTWWWCFLWMK